MRVILSIFFVTLTETDSENVIFELLLLFVKTMNADYKYSVYNTWNLQELIQTLSGTDLENISVSDILTLKTLC